MDSARVDYADSALGNWLLATWSPDRTSPLYGMVDRIWYFDGRTVHARERVFPDGMTELIVHLDDLYRDGDRGSIQFPRVCINGLRTHSSVVEAPGKRCRVLGIRLTPSGACAILRGPLRELTDVTVDLDDCLTRAGDELGERCAAAAGAAPVNAVRAGRAVLECARRWCLQRAGGEYCVDGPMLWALRTIASRHDVSLEAVASGLGLNRARFAARFEASFGVTPKRYWRILRFNGALSLLAGGQGIAHAANAAGYYDQSHMYRDFGEFAGMTPAEFLSGLRSPGAPSLFES